MPAPVLRALLIGLGLSLCAAVPRPSAPAAPPLLFEVGFPEKPKQETAEKVLQFASGKSPTLEVHRYSVERPSGIFVVTWFDVPSALFEDAAVYAHDATGKEAARAKTAAKFVEATVTGVAGSLGGRVDRQTRVKRDDEQEVSFGGPLLDSDKKTKVGVFEGRAILHYDRPSGRHVMYTVLAAAADSPVDHQRALSFVKSFTLKRVL